MLQRNGLRLLVEMAMIVATAAVTGFAHLAAWTIVSSVVVVWLAISVFEYSRSHLRLKRRGVQSPAIAGPPAEATSLPEPVERVRVLTAEARAARSAAPVAEPAPSVGAFESAVAAVREEHEAIVAAGAEQTVEQIAEQTVEPGPELFAESVRVLSTPRDEPADEPADEPPVAPAVEEQASVGRVPEPETQREPEPEPAAAAEPEPEPEPAPEPEQAPAQARWTEPWPERAESERLQGDLGDLAREPDRRTPGPAAGEGEALREVEAVGEGKAEPDQVPVAAAAWSWNVWNLERVVRERASSNEELNYLLLYLRDYANPAGMLPPDFDALVRESFGDLLAAPA